MHGLWGIRARTRGEAPMPMMSYYHFWMCAWLVSPPEMSLAKKSTPGLFFRSWCPLGPKQHISLSFSTRVLPGVTTCITLDESYLPDEDIQLFLADKFQEIKSMHPLCTYIPPVWPLPNVFKQLIKKSSGQFIYASTVINYVTSIWHKPTDRCDRVTCPMTMWPIVDRSYTLLDPSLRLPPAS